MEKKIVDHAFGAFENFINLNWMWLKKVFLGKNMYMTLEWKEENMDIKCIFIIVMENGWWIFVDVFLFYLKYVKNTWKMLHIKIKGSPYF
jgi:hypothetical protein